MSVIRFLESNPGRVARSAAGLGLIAAGLAVGGWWLLLSLVGLVPLAAGVFDFCLAAPLFHRPLHGQPG